MDVLKVPSVKEGLVIDPKLPPAPAFDVISQEWSTVVQKELPALLGLWLSEAKSRVRLELPPSARLPPEKVSRSQLMPAVPLLLSTSEPSFQE